MCSNVYVWNVYAYELSVCTCMHSSIRLSIRKYLNKCLNVSVCISVQTCMSKMFMHMNYLSVRVWYAFLNRAFQPYIFKHMIRCFCLYVCLFCLRVHLSICMHAFVKVCMYVRLFCKFFFMHPWMFYFSLCPWVPMCVSKIVSLLSLYLIVYPLVNLYVYINFCVCFCPSVGPSVCMFLC